MIVNNNQDQRSCVNSMKQGNALTNIKYYP